MSNLSVKNIIAEAQEELGLTDNKTDPLFMVWAYEAQREIAFVSPFKKESEWIRIDDQGHIPKPCDMVIPQTVLISEDKRTCVEPRLAHELVECGCMTNTNSSCDVLLGEKERYFWLSNNGSYRYAKIIYYGAPVDSDGYPVVMDEAARAVKQYINYMYTRRLRKVNRDEVPMSEVEAEYTRWIRLRNEAIGSVNMPKGHDISAIADTWLNTGPTPSKAMIDMRYRNFYARPR